MSHAEMKKAGLSSRDSTLPILSLLYFLLFPFPHPSSPLLLVISHHVISVFGTSCPRGKNFISLWKCKTLRAALALS